MDNIIVKIRQLSVYHLKAHVDHPISTDYCIVTYTVYGLTAHMCT